LDDDMPGAAAIMRNANWHRMALTLAKLSAVLWADTGCRDPQHLRAWAAEAVDRR
jgi:hypothetical protein